MRKRDLFIQILLAGLCVAVMLVLPMAGGMLLAAAAPAGGAMGGAVITEPASGQTLPSGATNDGHAEGVVMHGEANIPASVDANGNALYDANSYTKGSNRGASVTTAEEEQIDLILNEVNEVMKLFPFTNPFVSILNAEVTDASGRKVPAIKRKIKAGPGVDNAMASLPGMTTTLKTAIAAGNEMTELDTNDNALFQPESTILVRGINGYYPGTATVDPRSQLQLYVVDISNSNKPIVKAVNGSQASATSPRMIPAIAVNTKLTRSGVACSETQVRTANFSAFPELKTQFMQKFILQIQMSNLFKNANKRYEWTMEDIQELGVFQHKREQNISLLGNGAATVLRTRNKHIDQQENVYFTEGLAYQVPKRFVIDPAAASIGAATLSESRVATMMNFSFGGTATNKRKLMLCGRNLLEMFDAMNVTHLRRLPGKKELFDMTFDGIDSSFGTLYVIQEPSFEDLGWDYRALIIDPDYLQVYDSGRRVRTKDALADLESDSMLRVFIQRLAVSSLNDEAHCIVDLVAPSILGIV
ncbi:MAG: hypothetical protein LBJ01_06955 [Tannerella sp.]|jgi:hypothetical protein|nr:hypothetical protein [Tannerella sp.]